MADHGALVGQRWTWAIINPGRGGGGGRWGGRNGTGEKMKRERGGKAGVEDWEIRSTPSRHSCSGVAVIHSYVHQDCVQNKVCTLPYLQHSVHEHERGGLPKTVQARHWTIPTAAGWRWLSANYECCTPDLHPPAHADEGKNFKALPPAETPPRMRSKSIATRDFKWSGNRSETVFDRIVPEIGFGAISLAHPTSVRALPCSSIDEGIAAGSWARVNTTRPPVKGSSFARPNRQIGARSCNQTQSLKGAVRQ